MSVARVYLPSEKKYKSVETSSIRKFHPEVFESDDEEQKKKIYELKEGRKGKSTKCQVLQIRTTFKELAESVSGKRLHVPKLNTSQIKTGWQLDSDEDSVKVAKKTRKVGKEAKKEASNVASQDIMKTYLQKTKEKDSNDSGESQAENQECSSSEESVELQKKFDKLHKAYIDMTDEVERQKAMINELTTKYEQLKTSKSYPLTEKTGRQILAVLNNDRWQVMPNVCDKAVHNKDLQMEPKIGAIKGEETYIGKGAWISTVSYEALLREKESSKFVSGLSRSIWGVKPLSERCVRKQINTKVEELSPKKKAAVANFFETWMRDKRKYPEDLIADELKKLNKYFNGAITSARSTIAPRKRKSHFKDDHTLRSMDYVPKEDSNANTENDEENSSVDDPSKTSIHNSSSEGEV